MLEITPEVRASIAAIVDYDWATEERDYMEQMPEDRDGHVFTHLQKVQAWLEATS